MIQVITNLGSCSWCDEPVLSDEPHEMRAHIDANKNESTRPIHRQCAARIALGSVGHQMGLCGCNGGPGTMDDPPNMTKREAADAAELHAAMKEGPGGW